MKAYIVNLSSKTDEDKTQVQIFGRLENGKSFAAIIKQTPYFFIREIDEKKVKLLIEKADKEKTNLADKENERVIKISHESQAELNKIAKAIHQKSLNTYEADLSPSMRFIIDNNLQGIIEISGETDPSPNPLFGGFGETENKLQQSSQSKNWSLYSVSERVDSVFINPSIKTSVGEIPLKVLSIDLESNKSSEELFCIGLYSEKYEKNFIISDKKIDGAVSCKDEREILSKFRQEVIAFDPDIITGWHVIDFDLNYLKKKFEEHNIPFDFGRTNERIRIKIEDNFFRSSTAQIPGRQVLDGLNLIKDPFIQEAPSIKNKKFESYTLESVAQEMLGEGKLISGKDRHDEIEILFKTNKEKLVKYNIQDCKLAYNLLVKTPMLDLAIERSVLTGLPLNKLTGSIVAFDSLYIREARKRGLVSPTTHYKEKEERIKGGFVMEPKPGIYHNVLVLDFKSLYPSIIKTFNIDPLSMLDKKERGAIESPNKAYFKNSDGILPHIIERLHFEREKAKKEKRELSSYAIKIIMNCFSPDTEILTEKGIKNIEKIEVGDKVYSINPDTNQTEILPVTKKFFYPYKGDMIKIKTSVVDYLVTPNHRFLVDFGKGYEWKEARQLINKKQFWLPKHSKINGNIIKEINLEELCKKHNIPYRKKMDKLQAGPKHSSINAVYNVKDWLEFLGWYLSEGHIYTSKPKRYESKISWRGVTKVVMINQKIKENREKIENLLKRMGLKYCVQFNGLSINNHILANILEKECGIGSNSKNIPNWIYSLDHSILINLFNSLMLGDGNSNGERYSTKCESLSRDVLRLVHHIGMYGFVYFDKSKYLGEDYKMFRVQINKNRGIRPYVSPKRNMSIEKFDGNVVCVEVPPNHTVLAGRNTRLNFCGQSFFGVLASPNCRYFSLDMANAITHFGQQIIQLTAKKIEEKGYKVIYSDTDSVFINTNLEKEKAIRLGEELQNYINKFYEDYVKKEYSRKSYLELEFKKNYLALLLPKTRNAETETGSKKRYAGLVEENGKEKVEVTGLEAIRGDWTEAAKDFQLELLNKIFHKEDPINFIKSYVKNLREGKMDKKLIYRKSIRKDLKDYTKTTPPHVKAARKLDSLDSNIIEYYVTANGPEPIQKHKSKIDYEHYIKKQITPIADSILHFFNRTMEDILKDTKQTKLF